MQNNRVTNLLLAAIALGVWVNVLAAARPEAARAQGTIADVNLVGIGGVRVFSGTVGLAIGPVSADLESVKGRKFNYADTLGGNHIGASLPVTSK